MMLKIRVVLIIYFVCLVPLSALAADRLCEDFFILSVREKVGPFKHDSRVQDLFLESASDALSEKLQSINKHVQKVYRIKNKKNRSVAAKNLLPEFEMLLSSGNIEVEKIYNREGAIAYIILPSEKSSLNRLAKYVQEKYDHMTIFDPQSLMSKKWAAFVSSSLTGNGEYAISIESVLRMVATESEGHEIVHLETAFQIQRGVSGLFTTSIYLKPDISKKQLKHRVGTYDKYMQLDELVAYTHTLIERSHLLSLDEPKTYKQFDRYSRLLAQLSRRANHSAKRALERFSSTGAYFKVLLNKAGDRRVLELRIDTDNENIYLYNFNQKMIELWEARNMKEREFENARWRVIEHEANYGKLNELINHSELSSELRTISEKFSAERERMMGELNLEVENGALSIKYDSVGVGPLLAGENYKDGNIVGKYIFPKSLDLIDYLKSRESFIEARDSTRIIFTEADRHLKLIDEVSSKTIEYAKKISTAAKAKDKASIVIHLDELARYLHQYQYLEDVPSPE